MKQSIEDKKIIAIVGPTSCSKTKIAINLAKKFNGEIVGADSRQIYKGLDIGTGKDLEEYGDLPYHLIDIVKPDYRYSLAQYQNRAYKAIDSILKKQKIPFLVGGSGLYLNSVLNGISLPKAKPNQKLRKKLQNMQDKERIKLLKSYNPPRNFDFNNPRRVIRAIEICIQTGSKIFKIANKNQPRYNSLVLGKTFPINQIRERIKKRVDKWMNQGLVQEVKELKDNGLSWQRLDEIGLEYRYVSYYLQGKIDYKTLIDKLIIATGQYAKRQITWFKKDKRIIWIKNRKEAQEKIRNFLS
ncbi:MAG: tRNA (adenosine(37)-N6)-dimethylallyltransferase MiaA [Candidatus Moranbacteria bacterium]|nr:tRNA (adenosine(37)-N6)-dimethylallyltransferase MiaA [Candidatus Moranbacteria bacterium]